MRTDKEKRLQWECRFCGVRYRAQQRPRPTHCGRCRNSLYGTHYWDMVQ